MRLKKTPVESFFILFMFLFGLLITFIWMYIANRASLALDRLSRTRNVEVAEPFLRKNIVFSDDDFQTFLKDWNREIGFDPGEVIEAFMKWKIERHYRELRSEVLYDRPENVADPMRKIWRALRWKS